MTATKAETEMLLAHDDLALANRARSAEMNGVFSHVLHDEETLTCSTLCICCRDLVGSLDKDQRIIHLTTGYFRENCEFEFPAALLERCLRYLGGTGNFNYRQLSTAKELDEHWYRDGGCFCTSTRNILYALCVLLAIIIFVSKDAAAIYMHQKYACHVSGSNEYMSLNASSWLLTAAITHMALTACVSYIFAAFAMKLGPSNLK